MCGCSADQVLLGSSGSACVYSQVVLLGMYGMTVAVALRSARVWHLTCYYVVMPVSC